MPPFVPITELVSHIQNMCGLRLCLKHLWATKAEKAVFEGLPSTVMQHYSTFCMRVKKTRNAECIRCDLQLVPSKALTIGKPFAHVCHAGASEVIVPIILDNRLIALGYIGQFRESDVQPAQLPYKTPDEVAGLISLGVLLQRYFLYEITKLPKDFDRDLPRGRKVRNYLVRNLRNDPRLEDVAREFGISVSRAGHMIKEETGQSFVQLKLSLRIDEAKRLLQETIATVEYIAFQLGFNDVRYFYRVFQQETGMTPGEWRRNTQSKRVVQEA